MKSLIEELELKDTHTLVHETVDRQVYAHTVYYEIEIFDYDNCVTEDNTPVDNIFSEKQQRFLIDPLRINEWTDRKFMACANVALYHPSRKSPVVPDMLLSFEARVPDTWFDKKDRCYFTWLMGKSPDLVLEIVSNKVGGENTEKMGIYAKMEIPYYIIHDPYHYLYETDLHVFALDPQTQQYVPYQAENLYMPEIELGIRIWRGMFEEAEAPWARWFSKEGEMLDTGAEATAKLLQENETLVEERTEERLAKENALVKAEEERLAKENERLAKENALEEVAEERLAKENERLAKENALEEVAEERLAKEVERIAKEEALASVEKERIAKIESDAKVQKLMEQLKSLGLTPLE